jgi:hypothetical protein
MDTRLTSAFWTLRIAFGLTAFLAGLDAVSSASRAGGLSTVSTR